MKKHALVLAASVMMSFSIGHAQVSQEVRDAVNQVNTDPTRKDTSRLLESLKARAEYLLQRMKVYPALKEYYWSIDPRGLFNNTQESERERFISQMDFAKKELSNSKLVRMKTILDKLQREILDLRKEKDELRVQMDDATPAQEQSDITWGLSYVPLVNYLVPATSEEVYDRMKTVDEKIAQDERDSEYVLGEITKALRSYNIQTTPEEVRVLFATVTGDLDLEVISSYENVRALVVLLQDRMQNASIEMGREYYGTYALMLAALINVHEHQLYQINEVYLPALADWLSRTYKTKVEAQELQKSKDVQNPDLLKSNEKANAGMYEIGLKYQDYLKKRAKMIEEMIKQRRQAFKEVLNTHNTYDNGQRYVELIQASQKSINALDILNISELPKLINLGDSYLIDQINQINEQVGLK